MTLDPKLSDEKVDQWLEFIREFLRMLAVRKKQQFNRRVSVGDLLTERSENAAAYGFKGHVVSGNDLLAVVELSESVMHRTREGGGSIVSAML